MLEADMRHRLPGGAILNTHFTGKFMNECVVCV